MALYLFIIKIITTIKFIDIFFNKVLRHFKTPKGIVVTMTMYHMRTLDEQASDSKNW